MSYPMLITRLPLLHQIDHESGVDLVTRTKSLKEFCFAERNSHRKISPYYTRMYTSLLIPVHPQDTVEDGL